MTEPDDQAGTPVRLSAGGWPEPGRLEETPGDVGWPKPDADDPAAVSDESALEAWLDERDAATRQPEQLPAAGIAPAAEEPATAAEAVPTEAEGLSTAVGAAGHESGPDAQAPVAVAPVDDDAPASPEEQEATAAEPAPRSVRVLVLAGLLAVLLSLDAFLGVAWFRTRGIGADEEGRRKAMDAARNAARLVFSYDYRQLDKDFAAGLATTTGDFRAEYTRTTALLKKDDVPGRYKAVVVSDVSDSAVVTGDDRRAEVLVFLDQQSTSTLTTAPKITQSRVVLRMVNTSGRWLVEDIDAL